LHGAIVAFLVVHVALRCCAQESARHDHRPLRIEEDMSMGRLRSLLIPGVDKQLLVRDATKVMPDLARRRFITGGASLGALTLLTAAMYPTVFQPRRC